MTAVRRRWPWFGAERCCERHRRRGAVGARATSSARCRRFRVDGARRESLAKLGGALRALAGLFFEASEHQRLELEKAPASAVRASVSRKSTPGLACSHADAGADARSWQLSLRSELAARRARCGDPGA